MRLSIRSIENRAAAGDVSVLVTMHDAASKYYTVSIDGFDLSGVVDIAESRGGGVKSYDSLDAVLKAVSGALQLEGGEYSMVVNSGDLLLDTVPLDVMRSERALWVTLGKEIDATDLILVDLAELLANLTEWDTAGTAAQMAYMVELRARQAVKVLERVDLVALKNRAADIINEPHVV